MASMRVAVVGQGYVGLTASTGLAKVGNDIVCEGSNCHRMLHREIPPTLRALRAVIASVSL